MSSDMEILQKALRFETTLAPRLWRASDVGATQSDINRLKNSDPPLIEQKHAPSQLGPGSFSAALYKLTEEGRRVAQVQSTEQVKVTPAELLKSFELIVGFDDLKETLAYVLPSDKRVNFLFDGPPACAKTVFMDAIRNTIPNCVMAFGASTSAAGLSDEIFRRRPDVICLDEVDEMRRDVLMQVIGLMQTGELTELKSGKTRGVKLNTKIIAACNNSKKLPQKFKSRCVIVDLPAYTRDEFIAIVQHNTTAEGCPASLAEMIGRLVFDNNLGDVRRGLGVWQMMREATEAEALRILNMQLKYSPDGRGKKIRMVGML